MPDNNEQPLRVLREVRNIKKMSQEEAAIWFELEPKTGRNQIRAWENWRKSDKMPEGRYRSSFIRYLGKGLGLKDDRRKFEEVWQVIHEEWKWLLITDEEWERHFGESTDIGPRPVVAGIRSGQEHTDGSDATASGGQSKLVNSILKTTLAGIRLSMKNMMFVCIAILCIVIVFLFVKSRSLEFNGDVSEVFTVKRMGEGTLKIDGICNEYAQASFVRYDKLYNLSPTVMPPVDNEDKTGLIYFYHDNSNLYICLSGSYGANQGRNIGVFINNFESQSPYLLQILTGTPAHNRETTETKAITTSRPDLTSLWEGAADVKQGISESGEFRIPLKEFGLCGAEFRIGVYHQWVETNGTAYGWPEEETFWLRPDRWQLAELQGFSSQGNLCVAQQ